MITAEQIQELNKLGYNFHWSDSSKEYFDDSGENEMGLTYYPDPSLNYPYTLRARIWNDEDGEYEDKYEHFRTFEDLKAYLR